MRSASGAISSDPSIIAIRPALKIAPSVAGPIRKSRAIAAAAKATASVS
ncbi:MAG: hypothetical protein WDN24_19595 [Sphingomonas sp.]